MNWPPMHRIKVPATKPPGLRPPRLPAATEREQAPYPQLVHTTAREDEPAEFLLEEAPRKVPVSALVASTQASRAQLSDTLAAIESELFGGARPPTDTSSGSAEASIPAKPVRAFRGARTARRAHGDE